MGTRKKILAFLLASAMVLSLSACGNAENGTEQSATGGTTVQTAAESTANNLITPNAPYPEPIVITTGKILPTDPKFPQGQDSRNNLMLDLIKERLNVTFKILWEVDQKDYKTKLGLSIAAGEMPDMAVIEKDDYLTFRQLIENDALADLTEVYDKCAGDYMKKVISSNPNILKAITVEDKLYAYPDSVMGYNNDLLWVRNDWLKKLGLQAPRTIEDIKNTARAFIQQDPGGNGAGKTIGMVLNSTTPLGSYSNYFGAEPIANALGAYPKTWMKDAGGTIYYGSAAPEMKQALAVLADMYHEGLIDKSFLTRKSAGDAEALIKDNKVGMFFSAWWAGWPVYDLVKTHPEADWIPLNAPLDADGKFKHNTPDPTGNMLVVNKNCKYPEAVIKVLNLEFDAYRGIDAEAKTAIQPLIDNGTFQAAFPTGAINLEYYDVLPKLGHRVKEVVDTGKTEWDATTTEYDKSQAEECKKYAASRDPKEQTGWIAYYTRYLASTILDAPENVEFAPAFSFSTESMPELKPALDALEDTTMLQIITGSKPVDYFDEFVTQWKQTGGDKLTQEVQALAK